MTRLSLLALGAAALATTLLSSCVSTKSQPGPAAGSPAVTWPTMPYATVRAFAYDCDADVTRDFIQPGGRIAKGVLNPPGALLTRAQMQQLQKAITVPQEKSLRTPCYAPHHAFVFYDAAGNRVAHLEICFMCNKHRAYPAGLPAFIDMQTLADIIYENGVPYGKGRDYYSDLYKQKHAGR